MNHLRRLQALRPGFMPTLFCLPGKVPSPSQLSVTELPGDEVRLEWVAAAASGVLVYQITWTPLGDGKAHEVQGGERRPPPHTHTQLPGAHTPAASRRYLVPPLHRSPSQGTWARPSCPAWGGTPSMISPSLPTTETGPAATPCPSATPPVRDPSAAWAGTPRGTPSSPSMRPGPQNPRIADRQFSKSLTLGPDHVGFLGVSLSPPDRCSWGGRGSQAPGGTVLRTVLELTWCVPSSHRVGGGRSG